MPAPRCFFSIVFKNHIDMSLPLGNSRRLITEHVLMPSSHTLRALGCPVSSAFRKDATYVSAARMLGTDKTSRNLDTELLDPLLLTPCNCSSFVSNVC
jgi:hypothetical protein